MIERMLSEKETQKVKRKGKEFGKKSLLLQKSTRFSKNKKKKDLSVMKHWII